MKISHRVRRIIAAVVLLGGITTWLILNPASYEKTIIYDNSSAEETSDGNDSSAEEISENTSVTTRNGQVVEFAANAEGQPLATAVLEELEVKGRAPKTGYARSEFYQNWPTVDGCNLRQRILKRDLGESATTDENCAVVSGEYDEPYTGQHLVFTEKAQISKGLQIDHIVALSDAWQKGAQQLSSEDRYALATDALNLVAADAEANSEKSDGDAATWLPANKAFRCQYVARQIAVKYKYGLWVTSAEKEAMGGVLEKCPNEGVIVEAITERIY